MPRHHGERPTHGLRPCGPASVGSVGLVLRRDGRAAECEALEKPSGETLRGFESHSLRAVPCFSARLGLEERCESGRIGLTANELTWETGSEGSNPSLSA